jgi:hypothetical protein
MQSKYQLKFYMGFDPCWNIFGIRSFHEMWESQSNFESSDSSRSNRSRIRVSMSKNLWDSLNANECETHNRGWIRKCDIISLTI